MLRAGYTLLETTVVLLLIGVIGVFALSSSPIPAEQIVEDAARQVRGGIELALVEAVGRGDEALIAPGGQDEPDWLAAAVPAGTAIAAVAPGRWGELLSDDVVWSSGSAILGPSGTAASAPQTVRCTPWRVCDLGGAQYTYLYLSHRLEPSVVRAVRVSADGSVQVLAYDAATGVWR